MAAASSGIWCETIGIRGPVGAIQDEVCKHGSS
ncbi:hypothetical protein CCACVL1_10780 [Corchorus capsularis]|uniref:Uncharacterized protein n=1 Tax=Corchorus capsularis TaxID=210143 RepID=A0A1R3IPL8_COCAP|nr:hypothetical protein CCACVL1_10780 [Corchorus capsularis]